MATQPVNVAVLPPAGPVFVGDSFHVGVVLNSAVFQAPDGAQVYLNFDPAVLEVVAVVPGVPTATGRWKTTLTNQFDNVQGQVDFAAAEGLGGSLAHTPFNLYAVQFRALAPSSGGGTLVAIETVAPRQTRVASGGLDLVGTTEDALVVTVSPQELFTCQ